ncbi:MAG: endonuclease MutS2, partial [Armatimonadetes bacterium]|nr:endonuclease MutS2 [Armatimonadota bacterium]
RSIGEDATVLDTASEALGKLRREQRTAANRIKEKMEEVLRNSATARMLQESLITMRGDRYVVPVKAEFRGQFPGVLHDLSSSGATAFMEPLGVVPLGNRLRELQVEEQEEVNRILRALSAMVAERKGLLLETVAAMGRLDFAAAKAALSRAMKAAAPRLNTRGLIVLRGARHPLLVRRDEEDAAGGDAESEGAGQSGLRAGKVVPVDVEVGGRFTTLVITGPNTGGKTVTLKTVGLLTLMVQAGLHVPAEDGSHVGVFTKVFADIGDEQSIEQNLSTFSSHMSAVVDILRQVETASPPRAAQASAAPQSAATGPGTASTEAPPAPLGAQVSPAPGASALAPGLSSPAPWNGALVLLDEVGAGTDPTEGVALARSIIEHLHASGARTAVTTHYNELKALAYQIPGIENASVEFDPETLRPTFRLQIGVPGRSNAFIIAGRLGLPAPLVDRARTFLTHEERAVDSLLQDIERDRQSVARERSDMEAARREMERLRREYGEKLQRLEEERKRVLGRVHDEAARLLRESRAQVEAIIRELREEATAQAIQRARERLRELITRWDAQREAARPEVAGEALRAARPGDMVYVSTLGQTGTVAAGADERGEVEVQIGSARVRVPLSALRPAESAPASRLVRRADSLSAVAASLDIRGRMADEGVLEVDKYLDEAFLARLPRVTIIHGKGTGALRRAVHELLASHPHVRAYRLGGDGEGGSGATVVELDIG